MDPLPPDLETAIQSASSRGDLDLRVHYFREIGSTNDVALALADRGAPEGTAVIADRQTAGRGRRGRSWFSPAGAGIYLSCIPRSEPLPQASSLSLLSLASGVATARAITARTGLPLELKWPNDIVIGRPWRKLAGILCESAGPGPRVETVIIGVGVNVQPAAYPPELGDRATSIELELGRSVDRAPIAVEILIRLLEAARQLQQGQHGDLLNEWRELGRAGLAEAAVRWQDHGRQRRGLVRDIDDDGALIVRVDGQVERLIAGEVTWERLS
jgi:BirA family biotin operon repressor/biotin-[acetyl-CoA-carboxylase] ligase